MSNVPKLRFKEFSEEWEENNIKSLTSLLKDGSHGTHKEAPESEYLLLSAKNITNGNINIYNDDRRITAEDYYQIYKNYNLKKDDIVLTIVGTIGRSALVKEIEKVAFQRSVAFFRFKNNNSMFIYQLFNTPNFLNELDKRKVVSAQPGIYLGDLAKIKLTIPSKQEQEKIASFLTSVDSKIEQLTKKEELLSSYKKGVMQKIFSGEIRFKADDGSEFCDWEERKLSGICTIKKGSQLNKETLTEEGDYPALNGGINPSGYTTDWNTEQNTITISEGGNSCGYVNFVTTRFWSGGHNYSLKDLKEIIDVQYLFQYLKLNEEAIMRLRVGSGLPNIQKGELSNFKVSVPCLEEQTKIANFLSSIDSKIEQVQKQLNSTKEFKKALLQQMFV